MRRFNKYVSVLAVLALTLAACGDDAEPEEPDEAAAEPEETETEEEPASEEPSEEATDDGEMTDGGDLAAYGESTDADPALVERALGPVDEVPDIVLASIARASQDVDAATIETALACWNTVECDTGSGGELVMGVADGGRLNVWRQVTHMEAILQALSYPEIGTIVSRDAQWNEDPAVAAGDIRFLIQRGVDFIIGYPDHGVAIADAILEAEAAGIPYIPYSAGWVGLPSQDGSLIPGEDYTTIIGEDLCALGESFAEIINTEVGEGTIGIMGGTPGNALSAGWQECEIAALNDGIELVSEPADTYWVNDIALQTVLGWLSSTPDIAGFSYEYADGLFTALDAYETVGVELDDLVITVRTDEQTLFCDWVERGNPNYQIWYSAGGTFQSRIAVTTAMLMQQGFEPPAEIVVPHVMRQVSESDCDPDRVTPTVSGTSLVPSDVLAQMYPAS
ncbi:MAG TPA: substrate-binding domain-containing protein [Egicoccus sp.]|nr:substrate-binding domain-containing protein [Egicoccus sp.]HSK21638.1 substrate-binding domain-containing protein [Egicoccus sp.]